MSLHENQMDKRKPAQRAATRQDAPMLGQGDPADVAQAHGMPGVGQGSLTTRGDSVPHNMSRNQVPSHGKEHKFKDRQD